MSPGALGTILRDEGRYVQRDVHYWAPSGRLVFEEDRFFLPVRAIDPFMDPEEEEEHYRVAYDAFSLLVSETRDPVGNIVGADNDYRVLAPRLVIDSNLNRTEVAFDALGDAIDAMRNGRTRGSMVALLGDRSEAT